MRKEFKPIAMRCTQEQFEDIREELKEIQSTDSMFSLLDFPYLTNYYNYVFNIGSIRNNMIQNKVEIYEQWDKNIFLEACGIETKPTLEEVKEYFKDAKIVRCAYTEKEYDITKDIVGDIREDYKEFWIKACSTDINLWDEKTGYAEIIDRIEPKYKITKETILKYKMKDEFPEMFDIEFKISTWYVKKNRMCDWIMNYQGSGNVCFGFNSTKKYSNEYVMSNNAYWREATNQEIETALINEAKKRGFKEGVYYKSVGNFSNNNKAMIAKDLKYTGELPVLTDGNGGVIFNNGIWATIIEIKPMTQSEIETELGYKIEIVN